MAKLTIKAYCSGSMLVDYRHGFDIRKATPAEIAESEAAGDWGIIQTDVSERTYARAAKNANVEI